MKLQRKQEEVTQLQLPESPYISPHLSTSPISPYISLYLPLLQVTRLRDEKEILDDTVQPLQLQNDRLMPKLEPYP